MKLKRSPFGELKIYALYLEARARRLNTDAKVWVICSVLSPLTQSIPVNIAVESEALMPCSGEELPASNLSSTTGYPERGFLRFCLLAEYAGIVSQNRSPSLPQYIIYRNISFYINPVSFLVFIIFVVLSTILCLF
jgi:hypothetical protein